MLKVYNRGRTKRLNLRGQLFKLRIQSKELTKKSNRIRQTSLEHLHTEYLQGDIRVEPVGWVK